MKHYPATAFLLMVRSLPTQLVRAAQPNVVLVFIDDMVWGDFSCFGNKAAQTPNVDRLARECIRFEQFYDRRESKRNLPRAG